MNLNSLIDMPNVSKKSVLRTVRSAARSIGRRLRSITYETRCFFKPYNVVKIQALPRTWTDRDAVMFHAIFQIVVDFVELEQPFKDWDIKDCGKRFTDRAAMRAHIEKYLNSPAAAHEGASPEEVKEILESLRAHYLRDLEVLYLYEWYKDGKYDLDVFELYEKTGEKYKLKGGAIERVPNGKEKLITWKEVREIEEEHDIVCERMLQRVLAIRKHLWT